MVRKSARETALIISEEKAKGKITGKGEKVARGKIRVRGILLIMPVCKHKYHFAFLNFSKYKGIN